MKAIKLILEIFGWLIIVFGTTAISGFIAVPVYLKWPNGTGEVVAIIILSLGFLCGVIWATKIWKKHGTIEWLSGIRRIS